MTEPTLSELREIAEQAELGRDGLFHSIVTPHVVLHLLNLIDGTTRKLP